MDRKIKINEDIDRVELFGNLDVNLDLIKAVSYTHLTLPTKA